MFTINNTIGNNMGIVGVANMTMPRDRAITCVVYEIRVTNRYARYIENLLFMILLFYSDYIYRQHERSYLYHY